MVSLVERAVAHLQQLEADRLAAIAASEEKALEARFIEARQQGFRQAMELLGLEPSATITELEPPRQRRGKRRDICKLILTELSFTGRTMTTNQIAAAIDYLPERTEHALKRLESSGQLMRDEEGRWSIPITLTPGGDGATANGKSAIGNGLHEEVSRHRD
jgi:hypothetical protein